MGAAIALLSLFSPQFPLAGETHWAALPAPRDLKKLSLEELMEIEVTLVSRQSEKLTEAASAIQVITSEEIRRSGAVTLSEALSLAANLHVARINAHDFAIS